MPKLNEYTNSKNETPAEFSNWQKDPNEENYAKLMSRLKPVISSGIKSYGSDDLGIRARIIVDRSLHSFDPSKGASLNTHVFNNLKGLQRYRANRQTAVHTPEQVRLDKYKLYNLEKDYHDVHGVIPSDQTIADMLSISRKRVEKARAGGEHPEVLTEKGDQYGSKGRAAEDVWMDYVHHDLDDVNKKIFEWTTGYNNAPMLRKHEIAKKLGISAPAVSSRVNTIKKKLEDGLNDGSGNLL